MTVNRTVDRQYDAVFDRMLKFSLLYVYVKYSRHVLLISLQYQLRVELSLYNREHFLQIFILFVSF